MKRIACILILCLLLSPACLAEQSPADEFFGGLAQAWDGLRGMAAEAGEAVSDWANETGVADWAEGAAEDVSAWLNDTGITGWAEGAARDIADWFEQSGITEWTESAAQDIQAFIDENGPAVEAWLAQAGEDVQAAWNTLVHPDEHTEEEVKEAYETVVESLETDE